MPLIPLSTLDDSRLTVFRDVKATRHTRWQGRFVAEGARLVKRLLVSDFEIESLLIAEPRVARFEPWLRPDVPAFVLPQALAEELVGYNFHCGAMACAIRKPNPPLEAILSRDPVQQTLIVCPDVNDPENLGTLIRLGAAFGVTGILLGPACADPFSRRVLRVSMGNALTLPIVCCRDLRTDLLRLKHEWQVELAATVAPVSDPTDRDPDCDSPSDSVANHGCESPSRCELSDQTAELAPITELAQATRSARLALLFGNEAHGLSHEWLALCDRRLTIPMRGADSLNVAVAAGIFLYHLTRSDT